MNFKKTKKTLSNLVIAAMVYFVVAPAYSLDIVAQDLSLPEILDFASKITGTDIEYKRNLSRAKYSLIAQNKSSIEILSAVNDILRRSSLTLVGERNRYKVVNIHKAKAHSPPLVETLSGKVGYVGYIIDSPIKVDASLKTLLRSFSMEAGKIIFQDKSQIVLIFDDVRAIKKMQNLIIKVARFRKDIIIESVKVDFANIKKMVGEVNKLSLDGLKTIGDEYNNQIIFSGTESSIRKAKLLVSKMNEKKKKIIIEVLIAEVSEGLSNSSGVQAGIGTEYGVGITTSGGSSLASLVSAATGGDWSSLLAGDGTRAIVGVNKDNFKMAILAEAIKKDLKSNVLSTPIINTIDGVEAKFVVGKNLPFVTKIDTGDNPFQSVEREDVGLKLTLTATILSDGRIKMKVEQEISSVNPDTNIDKIVTNKRYIQTETIAQNNKLVVLGGLVDKSSNTKKSGVPFLNDIPYIGSLFSHEKVDSDKRKLLIFLKPTIVDAETEDRKVIEQANAYNKK